MHAVGVDAAFAHGVWHTTGVLSPPAVARVLVVDDDEVSRSTLANVLSERFDVASADSAEGARALLEEETFEVVLSDHHMPEGTGLSLMRWVSSHDPSTLRILVTGFLDAPRIVEAFNDGSIWQYVAKPWKREQLLQLVERGLEFRHSQQALLSAEQRYRDLFQNAPVGLMRIAVDGTVLEANRAIAASLGLEHVDVLSGAAIEHFVGAVGWTGLLDDLDRRQVVRRREMVLTSGYGRPVHVLLDAALRAIDGEVVIDLTTLDLTAERSAREETVALEKQLVRLQKHSAIESFAGGLVHDFNNFISIINTSVGFAGLVLREQPDSEWKSELTGCLTDIEHASAEGAALAQQLLTMVREGGTERTALEMNSISERVVRLLRRGYQGGPRLSTELEPHLPLVYANASQLHQCILNLCLNGLEAMSGDGLLRVITESEPGAVCITVADDGMGIPDAVRAQIFDPYFTTKGDDGGTGLGLSMVRAIVAQHGGEVVVDSTTGEGSRFTLRLPTADATDAYTAEVRPVEGTAVEGAPRVLFVDHDPALGHRVARALERYGYRVITESDGSRVLARFQAAQHDLALVMLDVALSEAGGAELVRSLREEAPDLPIVLAAASTQDANLCRALADPHVIVLEKPYRLEEIAEVVQRALES
ncbi:MAG: response regulator [Sandaracinaceae bacterium]